MAKTIQEAGGQTNGGAIPTSQAVTATTSIRQAPVQAGSALSKDLFGIMGEGAKIKQADMTASITAAKRVASDKTNQLSEFTLNLQNRTNLNNADSIRNARRELSQKRAELNSTNFENDDASQAFKSGFTDTSLLSITKINSALETQEIKVMDRDGYVEGINDYKRRLESNMITSYGEINDASTMSSLNGNYKKDDVENSYAQTNVTVFNEKTANGYNAVFKMSNVTAKEGWTLEAKQRTFDTEFGAWGYIETKEPKKGEVDNRGKIVFHDGVDDKARNTIMKSWGSFNDSVTKSMGSGVNLPYQEFKNQSSTLISGASSGKLSIADIEAGIVATEAKIAQLKAPDAVQLTDGEIEATYKVLNDLKIEEIKAKKVEDALLLGQDALNTLSKSGSMWSYTDESTGKTQSFPVDESYIKNYIDRKQGDYSETMLNSKAGSKEFINAITESIRLEQNSGVKNPAIETFVANTTGDGYFQSAASIDKGMEASAIVASTGTSNELLKNSAFIATINREKQRYVNGEVTETEYVKAVNNAVIVTKQGIIESINSGDFKKNWDDAVVEATDLWFKNVNFSAGTIDGLKYLYVASGGTADAKQMEKFLDANTVTFTGGFTQVANWVSLGFSENASATGVLKDKQGTKLADNIYMDGMENIVSKYNANNRENTIAVSDLRVAYRYKGGKNENQGYWDIYKYDSATGEMIHIDSKNGAEMTDASYDNYITDAERKILDEDDNLDDLSSAMSGKVRSIVPKAEKSPTVKPSTPRADADSLILKDDDDIVTQPQTFNINGSSSSPVSMSFQNVLMKEENSFDDPDGGWNSKTKKWSAHKSFEKGRPTIGYGHQLTKGEEQSGFITIGGKPYPITGITDGQAKAKFSEDFKENEKKAQYALGTDWNKMNEKNRLLATELEFNVKGGVKNFTEFIKAATNPDTEMEAYKHIDRSATSADGITKPLTKRNNALKKWYTDDTKES